MATPDIQPLSLHQQQPQSQPSPTTSHLPSPVAPRRSRRAPPQIFTYHCLCHSLLFASTTPLPSLPRRARPGLDRAYILPLPPPPTSDSEDEDEASDSEDAAGKGQQAKKGGARHYALLLGMMKDRRAHVVRREDGFEKRVGWRCGRCRLVVGYEIPDLALLTGEKKTGGQGSEEHDQEGDRDKRGKVIFIFPEGFVGTEDMVAGKVLEGVEIGDGEGE